MAALVGVLVVARSVGCAGLWDVVGTMVNSD